MIDSLHGPLLSDFAHRGLVLKRDPAGRALAAAATALLFAALAWLTLHGFDWAMPQNLGEPHATMVRLLPMARRSHLEMRDFVVHLIKPRLENAPMPEIVIAPAPSNAPRAQLPAATHDTAMPGGAAGGTATGSVSGVGTGGRGKGMAACIDPAYLEQIMRHVAHWYRYPDLTGASGIVYVHFVIDKAGRYQQLIMARSAGDMWLDGAAMRTMRQAEPLPPIPERFHTDQLDGVLPIIYQRGNVKLVPQQMGSIARGC